ncbi:MULTISPECIES: nuclear transport factor 2 family protein [Rothia]|uniref:Polyketide cyclase n=1 Tax=Rothia nasimurium TaxID=85336 RepID=A0A1Y1RQM5_9MICC|nr:MULTISPECIES: nuclear transport factor 2 family protein [Rothia]ORC18818.1 polyketide cyclase [Rothia nasimurium]
MSHQLSNARNLYLRGIRDGKIKEVHENYMGESYIQHSTGVPDGKEGFEAFFIDFFQRNHDREINLVRSFEDGNFVFLHVQQVLNGGEAQWVTADIFRSDENGRIVEHWDVIEAYIAPGEGQPDPVVGDFELDLSQDAETNKKRVRRFIVDVLQNGEVEALPSYIAEDLTQHTPGIGQGREAYTAYLANHRITYDFAFKVLGQGNFVVAYSQVTRSGEAHAHMDIFRLDQGIIVEMWSVSEPMPAVETLTNRGKF